MQTSVRIEGVDYTPCEVVRSAAYWGIKTPDKTFWTFPACDHEGNEIKDLPPYLPCEIRPVTNEVPDLTGRYPDTVKDLFCKRRSYFEAATLKEYISQYPHDSFLTEDEFEQARKQILSEPLEKFMLDPLLRLQIWHQHGTQELANQIGYIGDVYGPVTLQSGQTRRGSICCSVATSLMIRISERRKIGWDQAVAIVNGLKYVMIYDDVPEQQFIYLEGIKATPTTRLLEAVPSGAGKPQMLASNKVAQTLSWEHLIKREERLVERRKEAADQEFKNIKAQQEVEADRQRRMEKEMRFACEQSRQPVTLQHVMEALRVKTDRGARKIWTRHGFDARPKNQGELGNLVRKHERHKRAIGEATGKRNKARSEKPL